MPKDRRERSRSFDHHRASPYPCSSSHSSGQTSSIMPSTSMEDLQEWEEARCPVCMEHPHNAVLLMCSSHDKGCRPYMCDTSYRHSNCLDQFCKSFVETSSATHQPEELRFTSTGSSTVVTTEYGVAQLPEDQVEEGPLAPRTSHSENKVKPPLLCPLCRGEIKEWIVMEPARHFMNTKPRSCSSETCEFSGTYSDLRKHARIEHPLVRPAQANPERQRDWRRLERQRDLGDLLSTLQSSFGEERDNGTILPIDEGGLLTFYFLITVVRTGTGPRNNSSQSVAPRTRLAFRRRLNRWEEIQDGDISPSSRAEENDSSDGGSGSRSLRRRLHRRTPSDDI